MSRNFVAMIIAASIALGFGAQAMAEGRRHSPSDGWRDRSHNERFDRGDKRHHGWSQGQHKGWRDRNHDGRVDWRDQPGHVRPGHVARDRDRRGDWRDWLQAR